MSTPNDADRPPRILSLDGGGIRGKSSLLILENIMERLRELKGLDQVPRPCDYFDLIGGTSTGGIIAIMLGRLRMTVKECIEAYNKVGQAAFTPKQRFFSLPAQPQGIFSATALEKAIKQVVRENCTNPDCVAKQSRDPESKSTCTHDDLLFRDSTCTKTVVLAITKAEVDGPPTLFKTYDTSTSLEDCSIWQVARATSAATTFFKSIQLGRDKDEFIDAGFGYNNPTEVLIQEAEEQFPGYNQLRILSIGTGLGKTVTIQDSRRSILSALKTMASESIRVARRLESKYTDGGQYYRFNVERGLQDITLSDYQKTSRIAAHTRNYLTDNRRMLQKFLVEFFKSSESYTVVVPEQINTPCRQVFYTIPFPANQDFVGRDSILQDLQQKLFTQQICQKLAIVGLGGVGKTQVALQLAFWTQKNHPECSVFWLSALSNTSFDRDYLKIAEKAGLRMNDKDREPKMLVKQYLESIRAGSWLLIIDNIDDDTEMATINNYLPKSNDGLILFTTRSIDVAISVARRHILKLRQMDSGEAAQLFRISLVDETLAEEATVVARLLDELTYLPLAIMQAAAYLNRNSHLTIQDYLELLHGTEKDVVDLMSRSFPDDTRTADSRNAVATTWIVSFRQIQRTDPAAAQLLSHLSCIEPKAIPQSLFPRMESQEKQTFSIGTLVGFAFLARRGDTHVYDIHSLVHLATRIWIDKEMRMEETIVGALKHMETVFAADDHADQQVWQSYFTHAIRLLERSKAYHVDERIPLSTRVGGRLYDNRHFQEAVKCFEDVWEWKQSTLQEEDHSRLASEHELASAYLSNRQITKAIRILEHVVQVKKIFPEEDRSRLDSEHELAIACLEGRQITEAIRILEHIVKVQEILPRDDHSRIASEHALASAYLSNQQIQEAIRILELLFLDKHHVLKEIGYSRLASGHVLASAYLYDERIKEAIEIFEHIVDIQKNLLQEEDFSRLDSEHMLASAYLNNQQIKKAIEIFEHVVKIRKKLLQKEDHSRLNSEHELARAYLNDYRIKESIEIFEHVVDIRKKTLREKDYSRLASEQMLANAYLHNQQIKEAIRMLEHVVGIKKDLLAEDDPGLLNSQNLLEDAYRMMLE